MKNCRLLKVGFLTIVGVLLINWSFGQGGTGAGQNILQSLNTETTAASNEVRSFFRTVAWVILGASLLGIIYCAFSDSSRMKLAITGFLASALALAVGYGVGLF